MDAPARTDPEGTPPSERFVARQKDRLEYEREMLVRELASAKRDGRRWAEEGRLAGDIAAYLERKLAERLACVRRALEKIEEGTYGVCDVYGKPIPESRLEAVRAVEARRMPERPSPERPSPGNRRGRGGHRGRKR